MNISEFARKFRSSYLWYNIGGMVLLVSALIAGTKIGMDIYTHHGESISIPDIRRHSQEDAEHILNGLGFNVEVTDTGYIKSLPGGTVLEQSPEAGTKVKSGRTIYITINSANSPTLTLPDVIDNCSYREAKVKLSTMGFLLGEPQYIPGEKDWVYGVTCKGVNLTAGERISIEDVLVLQIGSGMLDEGDSLVVTDADEFDFPTNGNEIGGGDIDEFEVVE